MTPFVIILVMVIASLWISIYCPKEHFGPKKQLFTTNMDNMKEVLDKDAETLNYELMGMIIDILEHRKEIPKNWQGTTLCIDGVDLARARNGNTGTYRKLGKGGYFVRISNPERSQEMKCPYDLAKRRIGVFDRCDYHLVMAMAQGYRLLPTDFQIDYIPKNRWDSIDKLLVADYDVMYAYIVPGSKFQKTLYKQRVLISGFGTIDIDRIRAFYPEIEARKVYMDDLYAPNSRNRPNAIYNRAGPVNLLWVQHSLLMINDPKSSSGREPFISQLELSPEISDPSYRCYGELSNENRALCNSSYDPWGNPKENQTYWDTPCLEDSQCPFYMANKNYPNEFGKCMSNGICEFPIGIRRLAYVKYADEFPYRPMCYGCSPDVQDCCQDQTDHPEKYPGLASPDYAFPNDTNPRESRNMQTIIPML